MRILTPCLLFAAFAAFGQSAESLRSNPEIITDSLAGTFVLVKGGSFDMGSNNGSSDEVPVHRVTLSDYYIGETEVTQSQWRAVMGDNPSRFNGCDACPVEKVNWNDIQTFLQILNSRSGTVKYRLPTEAEWEYAARGGPQSNGYTYAGSNIINDVAWYNGNSEGRTHSVKSKTPNELGLYDMAGNVWEWCSDWYGNYTSESQTNPTGLSSFSPDHVVRGGSWYRTPQVCRVASRGYAQGIFRYDFLGFRIARSVSN